MLKRQIEKLETQSTDRNNVLVIVSCYFGPSGWIEPAIGYHVGDEYLFRLDDGTGAEFEVRPYTALRAWTSRAASVLLLKPIGR